MRFVVTDGDTGTSSAVTETINVAKDNDEPAVALPGGALSFTEGDGATIIDGAATVSDVDSADFNTGTLTIDFTANSTANDRLAINDEGAGVGNIALTGSDVTYDFGAGPVTIGTFAGGTDGSTPLVVTFNASATPAAVQALARNITFENVSEDPDETARTVRFVVTDGDTGTSTAVTETINVAAVNDDPVVALPGGAVSFTEGDGATIIDGAATVSDVDSADFNTGTLTIDFTANSTANDRLAINDEGAGVGNIALTGSDVTYDFGAGAVTIGTFVGGTDGSTPLVITFNASATPAAVQALARNITFDNVSEDPDETARTVRFVVTDGDTGTSTAVTETINVAENNDDPVLALPGGAVSFIEGDGATIIDGAATVSDVDSADFDTGTLTIDFTANSTANDRLAINDQGAGVGNISISGTDVTYDFGAGAVVIGTFAGGNDGSTPLVITFNANATPAAAQALAQSVTYDNVSAGPSTASRTVRFVLTDGDTGSSGAVTETITVAAIANDPVITLPSGPVSFTEDSGPVAIDAAATISDADSADFDTGVLTVDITSGGTAHDRLSIDDQGAGAGNISVSGSDAAYDFGAGAVVIGSFTGGTDGTTPLVITLNASADVAATQALVRSVTFDNVSQSPSAAARTVRFAMTDGDGGTSSAVSTSVVMNPVNDVPSVALPGPSVSFTIGDGPTVIDAAATVDDIDSADFDTGTLTVDFSAGGDESDRLGLRDQGAGVGNVRVSGSNVTYDFGAGAVVIGSIAGGDDGATPLVITFNGSSDATSAQSVLRNITYDNVPSTAVAETAPLGTAQAESPQAGVTKVVQFVLTDGDSGTSGALTKSIVVNSGNAAPTVFPATFHVSEDASGGSTVGVVNATDSDSGDQLTYSIVAGNAGSAFAINSVSGTITVNNPSALQDAGSFALVVEVVDDGNPAAASQATVMITVQPVVEAPDVEPPVDSGDPTDGDSNDDNLDPVTTTPAPEEPVAETPDALAPRGPGLPEPSLPIDSRLPEVDDDIPTFVTPIAADVPTDVPTDNRPGGPDPVAVTQVTPAIETRVIESPVVGFVDMPATMVAALDAMGDDLERSMELESEEAAFVVGSIEAGSIAFTAGIVAWMLRAGSIMTAFLSSLPMWMRLDPLPVLNLSKADRARMKAQTNEEEQSEAAQIGSVIDAEVDTDHERKTLP